MTIYVDNLGRKTAGRVTCRMIADSLDELLEFNERGKFRFNFLKFGGNNHEDLFCYLTSNQRMRAIELGAIEITRKHFRDMIRALMIRREMCSREPFNQIDDVT